MFRTTIEAEDGKFKLELTDNLASIGSCFADRIGNKLLTTKFKMTLNPFGVVFNPISIFKLIGLAIEKKPLADSSFLQRDNIYYNYDFHSSFSSQDRGKLQNRLHTQLQAFNNLIPRLDYLIITFGTAIVYKKSSDEAIVANCHKLPAKEFKKETLREATIVDGFSTVMDRLKQLNPKLKVILTVSPVRHTKEGLANNSLSKAVLRMSCFQMENRYPKDVTYFPSYEIMLDDLRDYRFYDADMVHPSDLAEDYIWEVFKNRMLSDDARDFVSHWEDISKALSHKAFHPHSEGHQKFLRALLAKLQKWDTLVNVKEEIAIVKAQMNDVEN